MIALIDGDVLVYSCGFSSDANARKAGLANEPLNFCLHNVNMKIKEVMDVTGATDKIVFLSHPINAREELYPEYKANRDTTHKPFWYNEIKEFLTIRHKAVLSEEGDEADDAMGIAQGASTTASVICTIDKDLDMIPGLHYNWSKTRRDDGVYSIDKHDANRFFYKQCLIGDSTDNIPGLWKRMGEKASKKVLAPIDHMTGEQEMYDYVLACYNGDKEFLHLIAKLLWIKRDNKEWEAP